MITSDTLKDLPPMRFDLSRVVGCAATRWSAARPLQAYLIDSTNTVRQETAAPRDLKPAHVGLRS